MQSVQGFPILYDTQVTTTGAAAAYQPGMIFVHRTGTGRKDMALVKYVQLDNNGCGSGEVLVNNFATITHYSVKKAATTDGGCAMRGIACATIASQYYGFMYISGYVESALQSNTTASGEFLAVSASTAGCLTSQVASCFNTGTTTFWDNASGALIVAQAHDVYASAEYGSVTIVGMWG